MNQWKTREQVSERKREEMDKLDIPGIEFTTHS
jgi:hypothetical protein